MNLCAIAGINVSRETASDLEVLAAKVTKWNPVVNLVSKNSLPDIMHRHIADSCQLLSVATPHCKHWVDLGSGGGFPGLVIAICRRDLGWPERITLVESDQRKSAFLREAARDLSVSVDIITQRIEDIPGLNADVVSARALAPLKILCGFARHHMAIGGTAIFPKGATHAAEIEDAQREWSFEVSVVPSKTDPSAAVLALTGIKHA